MIETSPPSIAAANDLQTGTATHLVAARPGTQLRASDAERERVAGQLRRHHVAGRLDVEEFQQRLEHCYAAKTVGALEELVSDLPREKPRRGAGVGRDRRTRRAARLAAVAPIITALVLISTLTGAHLFFLAVPLALFALHGAWWRGGWRRRHSGPTFEVAQERETVR